MTGRQYTPNSEHVVADVVEGEAVIINVATSIYYGTRGLGGWVWEQLAAGRSDADLVQAIVERYAVDPAQVRADLDAFIASVLSEGLMREGAGQAAAASSEPPVAYAKPELDIYRDMKDLLALDPPMPSMDLPSPGGSRAA